MEYSNLFLDKSEEELKILYEQYIAWSKTGILGDNELGKIRDQYCEMNVNAPLVLLENDILKEIAKKWYAGK